MQEPGAALVAEPWRYPGGYSPCPTLMPPESVPELFWTRLLAISMLCPQPWTKMPPPPWELLVMVRPSMLDGLHWKLLGNGFGLVVPSPLPQSVGLFVRRVVPVGNPANSVGSNGFDGKFTPF